MNNLLIITGEVGKLPALAVVTIVLTIVLLLAVKMISIDNK